MEDKREQAKTPLGGTNIRTFELLQYVSGFLEGGIDDWPANIQDAIYKALEAKSHAVQLPLTIVMSYCDADVDSEDPRKKFFVRIIASEIVAVDTGATRH